MVKATSPLFLCWMLPSASKDETGFSMLEGFVGGWPRIRELRASARGYARVDLPDPGGLLCHKSGICNESLGSY